MANMLPSQFVLISTPRPKTPNPKKPTWMRWIEEDAIDQRTFDQVHWRANPFTPRTGWVVPTKTRREGGHQPNHRERMGARQHPQLGKLEGPLTGLGSVPGMAQNRAGNPTIPKPRFPGRSDFQRRIRTVRGNLSRSWDQPPLGDQMPGFQNILPRRDGYWPAVCHSRTR